MSIALKTEKRPKNTRIIPTCTCKPISCTKIEVKYEKKVKKAENRRAPPLARAKKDFIADTKN